MSTPPPNAFDKVIKDEDVRALTFLANGEILLDVIRGQRYAGAPLGEDVFDAVLGWLNEYPGSQMLRHEDWRFFLTQMDEGVIFAERMPRMLMTLDDLFHYGWFQSGQRQSLLQSLGKAPFVRLLGVPLWAKTQLAVAITNSLKTNLHPLLGPGPWISYDMEDDEWAKLIAAKAAAGAECLVTASGYLAKQALQSGLKALWAPHPGYVDENLQLAGWPILDLSLWRNEQGQLNVTWQNDVHSPKDIAPFVSASVSEGVSAAPNPTRNLEPISQEPEVIAEVPAAAVKPPTDWGSTELSDSPGWELGEPPEPGQNGPIGISDDVVPQVSDISLEPPPDLSSSDGET